VTTVDPAEFLARVIMHIPEPRKHLVRYYGAYSNVSRGRRKRLAAASGDEAPGVDSGFGDDERYRSPDGRESRRRWRELIKRVYETDPLVCPSCGAEMRIIAFILDHAVVDAILRHLARSAHAGRVRGPPAPAHFEAASRPDRVAGLGGGVSARVLHGVGLGLWSLSEARFGLRVRSIRR
jgi:hypothetical protein